MASDPSTVKVALRIRPLVPTEISRGCKNALDVFSDHNQVRISDKCFTYNHVFDADTSQDDFYRQSVQELVPNLFKGYNVTILAYGQTGSGKTHSMGTAYSGEGDMGIIPHAVHDIFKHITDSFSIDFNVSVSFVELYQEVLYDLLAAKPREECVLEIREDIKRGVFIPGLTEVTVKSVEDVFKNLYAGSKGRATSSTNMNAQSSRSHAIFTILISMTDKNTGLCKTAKFHLVDLAGSERSKKTGATGQTFKEGVNINKGLFVLGNVISALGDDRGVPSYVNYRESVLTRLLKDSLGGNSVTMMVACVSPADYNVEETISTLRYADRARRIKNKPIVNEDPNAAELNRLRKEIQRLKLDQLAYTGSECGGVRVMDGDHAALKDENADLKKQLHTTVSQVAILNERLHVMQTSHEELSQKFRTLQDQYRTTLTNLQTSIHDNGTNEIAAHIDALKNIDNQFAAIDKENQKNEAEIKTLERSEMKDETITYITQEEIEAQQTCHTAKQIAMNEQFQQVTKILAQKEELARRIATNVDNMVDLKELAEDQSKIAELEKEKADLLQQLKLVQVQGASSKLAEQRRKRVQELEAQLHELNRKVNEQARLIKMKEKDVAKIQQLNVDISRAKAEKVQLVRAMRAEGEKFRKWKVNRERELSKLQNQERKRQNEMVNMKRKHTLQENVWKRKLEEAASTAKRLKDALALRKNVQDSRLKGKVERLGPWIQQELTIHVNLISARLSCDSLLEDRAALQEQLDKLAAENAEEHCDAIAQLQAHIDIRSAQLQEFQQRILESDDEERSRTRFDNVQTMSEAKYALKALFDMTADIKKGEADAGRKVDELQSSLAEYEAQLAEARARLGEQERLQHECVAELERNCQEKISILLCQLRGLETANVDADAAACMGMQAAKIRELEESAQRLAAENQQLSEQILNLTKSVDESPAKTEHESPAKAKPVKKRSAPTAAAQYVLDTSLDISSFEDNVTDDPDWRNTPLGKRMNSMRTDGGVKRSVSGGCGCAKGKGTCGTKICSCRKGGRQCGQQCRCNQLACANRLVATDDIIDSTDDETDSSPFKRPKFGLKKRKLQLTVPAPEL